MKIIVSVLMLTLFLSACNTIHGIGQDIERGGEHVKHAATTVQEKI